MYLLAHARGAFILMAYREVNCGTSVVHILRLGALSPGAIAAGSESAAQGPHAAAGSGRSFKS